MSLVATLICNPAAPVLDDAALTRAREALPRGTRETQLAEGIAVDFACEGDEPKVIEQRLREALAGRPLDVSGRLPASRQLSEQEAAALRDVAHVLGGWTPRKN